jgi:hypothetical protein
MTAVKFVYLECDEVDCLNVFWFGGSDRVGSVRREALTGGWRRVRSHDFCPKHATDDFVVLGRHVIGEVTS